MHLKRLNSEKLALYNNDARIQRGAGVGATAGHDSIQRWVIICPPAKHHVNDGPLLVVFGSSIPSSTTKNLRNNNAVRVELGPLWLNILDPRIIIYPSRKGANVLTLSIRDAYVNRYVV